MSEKEKTALFDPIIRRAELKRLPEALGLNDIAKLLFHHRYKTILSTLDQIPFITWINNQVEKGHIPIEGRTNQKLCLWRQDKPFEPIIHKNQIKICLEILDLLPLEEGCLLANWWNDDNLNDEPVIEKERQVEKEQANTFSQNSSDIPNETVILSKIGKVGAEKRHSAPGGSRDKAKQIRDIWATGKYTSRDRCAEEECAGLDMSFSAARRALRNTPDPDQQSS